MIDWDDVRSFLAVARHGSLSAGARALGVSQPTMGRRLAELESRLGTRLFDRLPSGHVPTAAGRAVLESAERMEAEALAIERGNAGRDVGVAGFVRATSPDWIGRMFLAPLIAEFCRVQRRVTVELVTDPRAYSLARREADIAFRLVPFEQQEVVQRKLLDIAYALYAAPSYLDRHGVPDFAKGAPGHALVLLNEGLAAAADTVWLTALAREATIAFRCNDRGAMATAAEAGAGLAVLPTVLAEGARGLVRVPSPPAPGRTLYLGVHADCRDLPRVRALVEHLAPALRTGSVAGSTEPVR
ncbi:LysR family transcriptional regulator [Arenibaculum pallidiluteum]|uniref:LysR family transcriptional regulator n=1 Tax=Arenibaculum pallidiluteum TaxID=2812559 RepID=UPI001A95F407|nr:LysR family transcriptional regulator [Arenibaculum pallidiluteum]